MAPERAGTKYGCGVMACGACTVLIDGAPTRTCGLPLSAVKDAQKITTIEGLSATGPHPLQKAWAELNVVQCGYCQSGMIMAAVALLAKNPRPFSVNQQRRRLQLDDDAQRCG